MSEPRRGRAAWQKWPNILFNNIYMAKKILLIEDDKAILELYGEMFRNTGYDLEIIDLGNKALSKFEEINDGKYDKPDLVLLDLILPDINGLKILERIRGNEKTRDLPVFILTNYSDPETIEESERLRAEKFIIKAKITPPYLLKLINEWLKN